MILWVWMFTISVKGIYYGCRDANDIHVFHGFIIWENNFQDNSQWVFFYKTIAMVIFYHDIFSLPSIDNLRHFFDKIVPMKIGLWYYQWEFSFDFANENWALNIASENWTLILSMRIGFWCCQWKLGFDVTNEKLGFG